MTTEEILEKLYALMNSLLAKEGTFAAFGVGHMKEGKLQTVMPADENSAPVIYSQLKEKLHSGAYDFAAYVDFVRYTDKDLDTDATSVSLMYPNGVVQVIYVPVQISDDGVRYGKSFVMGERKDMLEQIG